MLLRIRNRVVSSLRSLFGGGGPRQLARLHRFKPAVEHLEGRWCPATATWNPVAGGNLLWSNRANWSTGAVPKNTDVVVFDRATSSDGCQLDQNAVVDQIIFQNGYTGTLIVSSAAPGQGYSLRDVTGSNFTNYNPGTQTNVTVNINFDDSSCRLLLYGNNTFVNFSFTGSRAQVNLVQGSLNIQSTQTGSPSTSSDFLIGGTLNLQNASRLSFSGTAGVTIATGGVANIGNQPTTLLSSGLGGGIFENWGTVNFTGRQGLTTTITMPFLTHGTVNLGGGGTLDFNTTTTLDATHGVEMDSGSINLAQGVTLAASQTGYLQTGGTLSVLDSIPAGLSSPAAAQITGGVVQFTSALGSGFGRLNVTGNMEWDGGTLTVRINGQMANSDQLVVSGGVTVAATGPTLNITVQGALGSGLIWTVITTNNGVSRVFPTQTQTPPRQRLGAGNNTLQLTN